MARSVTSGSNPTVLFGFAMRTASTASVTMSWSYQFESDWLPSAVRTLTRLLVPSGAASWVGAVAADSGEPACHRDPGDGDNTAFLHRSSSLGGSVR